MRYMDANSDRFIDAWMQFPFIDQTDRKVKECAWNLIGMIQINQHSNKSTFKLSNNKWTRVVKFNERSLYQARKLYQGTPNKIAGAEGY